MAEQQNSMTALLMARYWIVPIDPDPSIVQSYHKLVMDPKNIGADCDEVMGMNQAEGALVYLVYPHQFFTPTQHANFQEEFDVYTRQEPEEEGDE